MNVKIKKSCKSLSLLKNSQFAPVKKFTRTCTNKMFSALLTFNFKIWAHSR